MITIIKTAFGSLLFSLAICLAGDSVVINKHQVWFHFDRSGAYLYPAAQFEHPGASYQVYKQTKSLRYLKQAANLGVADAALRLFQLNLEHEPDVALVWLKQAARLDHIEARLELLKHFVVNKNWAHADDYVQVHHDKFKSLTEPHQANFDHLVNMIQFARESELTKIAEGQLPFSRRLKQNDFELVVEGTQSDDTAKVNGNLTQSIACKITADVLVSNKEALSQVETLLNQFRQSSKFNTRICFNNPRFQPTLYSICDVDVANRIDCDIRKLGLVYANYIEQKQTSGSASHLLVVAENGEANTRGGLMLLDRLDTSAVLTHEVAHWLNFYDEYEIHASQQNILCPTKSHKRLGNNLIVARLDQSKQKLESYYNQPLFRTNTCNHTNYVAYKFTQQQSFMEYLDLTVSKKYLDLVDKYSTSTIPISMNFALAFKKDDIEVIDTETREFYLRQYVYWLTEAVELDFLPAKRMLAQYYISIESYLDADRLLHDAASSGDPTSQVLLGHYYIESTWLKRDLRQAAYWYKKAAKQNDPYGLYFYGKCLENGWGCIQDIELAFTYYQRASDAGSQLADKRLGTEH